MPRTQIGNGATARCTPLVSVAIPTRNRGKRIVPALQSVLASRYPNLEVIVVDQSVDDATKDAIEPLTVDPRLRYLASDETGNTRARNVALREAGGDILLYTDDDCTVPVDWVERMTRILDLHPRVAVVFCNVEAAPHDPEAGFVPAYVRKEDLLVTSVRDKCRARGIGAGMAVRRRAALEIGGFDQVLQACPDGDIAVRALLSGFHVYETSRVAVVHDGFRRFDQGRELARRNWVAIGAAYAKPLRAGHLRFTAVVAYEGLVLALLFPLIRTIASGRPQGLHNAVFFWQGFIRGMRTPLDRRRMLYVERTVASTA